ncbi:MAG: 4-hydroxy-tetrahydrodipicolinate synthase [Sphingobacteriales bacterium]|jgi:4-hydroxy-tetrahydrodipicolinate synthase|nr:4-hydroxy-tetrahydrodipicolinate synthase [Sphingobacteriales bacterium]MBP9141655.1 4-hydroxy-tetrahydrodipicolinate synthase [Chitinophagales bacterium]MDA0198842.1 4-hydroxy-tetrahydrodipicolinate synthase [Bacteroidota bacterium]MBK6891118.1 4-hydroxy-tetrahydrodipicolinate synthase [Sphingobacteriales bacterium]MBK7527056.1 4-hydroxy-tetrahydrodipicolinate synthase [Sphingobacteriales bacterium]
MSSKFKGLGVALVTPFTPKGDVDYNGLENVIKHCIAGGVDYLVSLGTTGESVTLSPEEKMAVLSFTIQVAGGRLPIVAGFGGHDTRKLVHEIQSYHFKGVDAILSVSPYYNKPSQEGIYQHFKAVAQVAPVPVIIYNVPGRTSSNISAATTLRLATDFQNIIGIKEASGSLPQCMQIVKNRPRPDFLVISGDDNLTLPMISIGMDGVISVIANAYPRTFANMVTQALSQNFEEARPLHYRLLNITDLIFAEGSPAGIKAVLNQMNICADTLRGPLANITDTLYQAIANEVKQLPQA